MDYLCSEVGGRDGVEWCSRFFLQKVRTVESVETAGAEGFKGRPSKNVDSTSFQY